MNLYYRLKSYLTSCVHDGASPGKPTLYLARYLVAIDYRDDGRVDDRAEQGTQLKDKPNLDVAQHKDPDDRHPGLIPSPFCAHWRPVELLVHVHLWLRGKTRFRYGFTNYASRGDPSSGHRGSLRCQCHH